MLNQEDNEILTRVSAGTPAGELLRRYWHPVAVAADLTEEKPIRAVKVLGEELVVYRDKQGKYGLLGEHCSHRMASLAYGRVDAEGIRCPYHGWKYDATGRCLEQPAEPPGSTFKDRIRHKAYRVEKLAGLLFAYLGPEPTPLLPRWDVLVREDGERWIVDYPTPLRCNWLQAMENSVDPVHLYWLHGDSGHLGKHLNTYEEKDEFIPFEYGIWKKRTTPGKTPGSPPQIDLHPLVFPTILRQVNKDKKRSGFRHGMQFRVPIDDHQTHLVRVCFVPSDSARSPSNQDPPRHYEILHDADGSYDLTKVPAQDWMAWETQGPVTDRTREHLAASDEGLIVFRKLLKEQIDAVQRGGEPLGVVRDPEKNRIIEFPVVNERIGAV